MLHVYLCELRSWFASDIKGNTYNDGIREQGVEEMF
jgi:hypothetical protein